MSANELLIPEITANYLDETPYLKVQDAFKSKLLQYPSTYFVNNIQTEMDFIKLDNFILPFSVNYTEYENAMLCSPFACYVQYPKEISSKFEKLWMKKLIGMYTFAGQYFTKLGRINQVININNNLLSLNRYNEKITEHLNGLTKTLIVKYPRHALMFSRVNERLDETLLEKLNQAGYIVFFDRFTHILLPENNFIKCRHNKKDYEILGKTSYIVEEHESIIEQDIPRIWELYNALFIHKHSKFNPDYTVNFFKESIKHHWHSYQVLRNPEGKIDGFLSWQIENNTLLMGPLGYDLSLPQELGLYRMLFSLYVKQAYERQLIFNMGGGNDRFKINRGSTPTLEYTAVYCKHLPLIQQFPWKMIHKMIQLFLPKILKMNVF